MRILIVEDERKVARFLERALREEGYAVDVAADGDQGFLNARVNDYDLLVLDVMLPGRSGFEVARELRRGGDTTPILFLTARDSKDDVVTGLDAGGDDYLAKPFSLDEALARIRALLRRGRTLQSDRLRYEDLEMDRLRREVRSGGIPVELTPREFALLEFFLLRPQQVIRRTELLEKVWDLSFDPMSNVVDVHVANLRRKLRGDGTDGLIHTVRGVGYILERRPSGTGGPGGSAPDLAAPGDSP